MKTVIASIHADYIQHIFDGSKKYEIRKNAPDKAPFEVLIYETKKRRLIEHVNLQGRGMVVGRFVCKKIEIFSTFFGVKESQLKRISKGSCLTIEELTAYERGGGSAMLFAWHIADVEVFSVPIPVEKYCKRPPQSYCYVRSAEK